VQDVPEPMRSRLIESTHSENSGTIVIADRAGKDQITQVIARRESAKDRKPNPPAPPSGEDPEQPWYEALLALRPRALMHPGSTMWVGVILFLAAVAIIIAVFNIHW
jgi:hypothetical protein